jgi:7,8-dihydropterin-6-yl-methyl-4-(beta-D-ribofuranosyl)aminobenzene 5'-phosphate synthase
MIVWRQPGGSPAWWSGGIYTAGQMYRVVAEQSLVLVTEQGLVVITGCAHPGIVRIVERAREIAVSGDAANRDVHLVLGGFHLGRRPQATIEGIVEDFQRLGIQKVAPCHCSGDLSRSLFERAYGLDFIKVGVGSRLEVGG